MFLKHLMQDLRLYSSAFGVGEEPFCVWGWELPQTNMSFLEGIDAKYFDYIADAHIAAFAGPDKHRAAVALRSAYHHGLEALFSLIGATLQSPNCAPAWIIKCSKPGELRRIIDDISNQRKRVPMAHEIKEFSWHGISELINGLLYKDKENKQKLVSDFA